MQMHPMLRQQYPCLYRRCDGACRPISPQVHVLPHGTVAYAQGLRRPDLG
jgi:hypothetical protein